MNSLWLRRRFKNAKAAKLKADEKELARRLQARGATLQLWDMVFAHDTLSDTDLASALASAHAVIGMNTNR